MKRVADYIRSLKTYTIPARYQWEATVGVSLQDIGFTNICDCLHKDYGNKIEPFPVGFDETFFNRAQVKYKRSEYIEIVPQFLIMAQRYLDRDHLIDINERGHCKPIKIIQCKNYQIVQDGHHCLAMHYMRGRRFVPARIKVMEM